MKSTAEHRKAASKERIALLLKLGFHPSELKLFRVRGVWRLGVWVKG